MDLVVVVLMGTLTDVEVGVLFELGGRGKLSVSTFVGMVGEIIVEDKGEEECNGIDMGPRTTGE